MSRLPRVRGALRPAGADDGVQLVDEQHDLAGGVDHLVEQRLEALLELTAVLRAREQGAEVERQDALVLEPLGDVAADDAARQSLDDRGLADAGFTDEDRVVLRAAAKAPASRGGSRWSRPMTGSSLPCSRASLREIDGVNLSSVSYFASGLLGRHALAAAHLR